MNDSMGQETIDVATLVQLRRDVRTEMAKVVVGYEEPVDLLLVAAVAGGHVLLEGPPGVAKTLMAAGMARVLGAQFKRIQFTPDTTPNHITGESVKKMGEPQFVPGAVFTNLLLADEINRTPPRTQSALLEAMQERHVTVDGRTHWLPSPFMVIATQNPYEQMGIFPLPESQLDRFLFKIDLPYGSADEEVAILQLPHRGLTPDIIGDVRPLLDVVRLDAAQRELDATHVADRILRYIVEIVRVTRQTAGVALGVSPRGAMHLLNAAKANARLDGRAVVERDDVVRMAPYVLSHRLILEDGDPLETINKIVATAS